MAAPLRRLVVMAMIASAVLCAGIVANAGADNAGQLDAWGRYGTQPGEFAEPQIFGVEPDGSVYVGDQPENYNSLRIQKFSVDGNLEGSVTISTPREEVFQGIAIDPQKGRFYLLQDHEGSDPVTFAALAEQILVFSTTPNSAGELIEPTAGPSTLPVPEGNQSIDNPTELAVDPHNGELQILGVNRSGFPVLQRIGTIGNGSIGPRYDVSPNSPGSGGDAAMAIDDQGTTYFLTSSPSQSTEHLYTLPEALNSPPAEVAGFSPGITPTLEPGAPGLNGKGPQIAITPDGETLYFKQSIEARENQNTPGNYQVSGYSLTTGATNYIFGGEKTELMCAIQNESAALAVHGSDLLVLDQGAELGAEVPSPFGDHVLRFGPGGSGCPAPSASLELLSGSTKVEQVRRGTSVKLDASGSELGTYGENFESATWTIDGPEGELEETVTAKSASALAVEHEFLNPGRYSIGLSVKLKLKASSPLEPTVYGVPTQTLLVTAGGSGGAPPTISKVDPLAGPAGGENVVTISGTRFSGTPTVKFGSNPATEVKVVNANTVQVTAPAGTPGAAVDVSVRTADGITARSAADRYVYENGGGSGPGGGGAGSVTGVSPANGPPAGGNIVTISGSGLENAVRVKFGAVAATEVTMVDDSTITAKAPPGVQGTTVDVTVVSSQGGTSSPTPSDVYLYDPLVQGLGVIKVGSGTGTVISTSAGINCGVECSAAFPQGATVILYASPGPGSTFAGWGGACSGQGPCVVGMTAAKGVTAGFEASKPPSAPRAPSIAPAPTKPAPKKPKCKKGAKLKKVGGKPKCVKTDNRHPKKKHPKKKHHKHHKHGQQKGKPAATEQHPKKD